MASRRMKRALTAILILVASTAVASRPPPRYTRVHESVGDAGFPAFLPNPSNAILELVSTNGIVWRRTAGAAPRRPPVATFFFVQKNVATSPHCILEFGGRRTPPVVGVSSQGSLQFRTEEEFLVKPDKLARQLNPDHPWLSGDFRDSFPWRARFPSPSQFLARLTNNRSDPMDIQVRHRDGRTLAVPVVIVVNDSDPTWQAMLRERALPSPQWLRNLWPIVEAEEDGFTIWNGTEWKQIKGDANKMPGHIP